MFPNASTVWVLGRSDLCFVGLKRIRCLPSLPFPLLKASGTTVMMVTRNPSPCESNSPMHLKYPLWEVTADCPNLHGASGCRDYWWSTPSLYTVRSRARIVLRNNNIHHLLRTCEWGPLLLQIINLQWDPSISHRTLKCIPDALKDWILKKKKNQIIEGGKDLNIYQTSGEKRLVKLGSVRKDHRERDGQNWLQKNLAHLYIKTEGRTYAGKNDRRRHYIFST